MPSLALSNSYICYIYTYLCVSVTGYPSQVNETKDLDGVVRVMYLGCPLSARSSASISGMLGSPMCATTLVRTQVLPKAALASPQSVLLLSQSVSLSLSLSPLQEVLSSPPPINLLHKICFLV